MENDPRQSSQSGESSVGTRAQGGGKECYPSKPKTWWRSFCLHFGMVLRWGIMALLSAYLLAMAMTLFEIDAFQTLVAQLGTSRLDLGAAAGNSRQREILQAVRASRPLISQSDRPLNQGIQAQHELVASKLDALRVATTALADIGKNATFQVRTDPTYQRAQGEEYQEISERVRDAVTDLRKGYLSQIVCPKEPNEGAGTDPGNSEPAEGRGADTVSAEDCSALAKSKEIFGALQDGIIELERLVPKSGDQPSQIPAEANTLLEEANRLLSDLKTDSGKLKEAIDKLDANAQVAGSLGNLVDKLDDLSDRLKMDEDQINSLVLSSYPEKPFSGTDPAQSGRRTLKQMERNLTRGQQSDDVVELRYILGAYAASAPENKEVLPINPPADEAKLRVMDEDLVAAVKRFQNKEGFTGKAINGEVDPLTMGKLNEIVDRCNADPGRCWGGQAPTTAQAQSAERAVQEGSQPSQDNGPDIRPDILRIGAALDGLKRLVAESGEKLKEIGEFTAQLAKIEVASRRLADLDITVNAQTPGNSPDDRRKYQAAVLDLSKSIKRIRERIGDSSGVIAIADAIGEEDPLAHRKATTILREYEALGRYQKILTPLAFLSLPADCSGRFGQTRPSCDSAWNRLANIGFNAKDLSTMTRQALDMMVVFTMGAIGSLIYLIRYLLNQVLLLLDEGSPVWRPLSWYLFRPLFGVVVAFALLLLYKTGQVALGGGSGNILAADVNLPILSLFSLFAGLLSWQALEMVEQKGKTWLSTQNRENLWASGLRHALRVAGKTHTDCAGQVGVTPIQVDRWISGQDKVTPEMQDRILTWLKRDRIEVFSDVNPRDIDERTLAWATGLKEALRSKGYDVPQLALLVRQDVETVQAWVDLKRQVDQPMQFLVAEKLGVSPGSLFSPEKPDADSWAIRLRDALASTDARYRSADALARAIGSTQQNIRRYMELQDAVPRAVQDLVARHLSLDAKDLFSPDLPLDSEFKWAAGLRDCMKQSGLKAVELADAIDVEVGLVRAWMEQEVCGEEDAPYCGQVAPRTQPVLVKALETKAPGCSAATLFRSERAAADFWWVQMPRFGELVSERGGVAGLASRLDLDVGRVEAWMAGQQPVAMATQLALLSDLGLPVEERTGLFSSRPPIRPDRPDGTWWATARLRPVVREHPEFRGMRGLAASLEIPERTLLDQVEQLEPVPTDLRDRIQQRLGPALVQGGALFSTGGPKWAEFRWAPGLRGALLKAGMNAAELAAALDTDVERVQAWMEMDAGDPGTPWARDNKLKRGQVCPATQEAIVVALGRGIDSEKLFSETRPEVGTLWAVKPVFRMAVDGFDGRLSGFAEQVDAAPDRVERWAEQLDPVDSAAQDRILEVLGLKPEDRAQLFAPERRVEQSVG